jgi:hypothetical protein
MSGSTTAQSLGIIDLIFGGTKLAVDKGASFMTGGLISTPVVAGRQITNSQQMMPASVKASFPLTAGMSLAALKALNGSELQVKCDTGQTYIINGAFFSKDPAVKGGGGSNVSAEWSGQPAQEAGV